MHELKNCLGLWVRILRLEKRFDLLPFRLLLLFLLYFLFETLWIVIFSYMLNSEVFQNQIQLLK